MNPFTEMTIKTAAGIEIKLYPESDSASVINPVKELSWFGSVAELEEAVLRLRRGESALVTRSAP